jgi:hypothetical protein
VFRALLPLFKQRPCQFFKHLILLDKKINHLTNTAVPAWMLQIGISSFRLFWSKTNETSGLAKMQHVAFLPLVALLQHSKPTSLGKS